MATRKRRESWGAIRRRPSGRYQASFVGPDDGKRYNAPHTFDTQTDARAWLRRQKVAIDTGQWHSPADAVASRKQQTDDLATFAHEWIATRSNRYGEGLRPRTRTEYERLLAGPLAGLGAMRLHAITPADIRTWFAQQIAQGTATQTGRAYSLLKSILSTAVEDGRIKSNPCQIRGASNASTGRRVDVPSIAEVMAMSRAISPRFEAAILIAAYAGTRYGELTELRRHDVRIRRDDAGNPVSVSIQVARGVTHSTGIGFTVGRPKSLAGIRSIVLPPHVVPTVVAHLQQYTGSDDESLLFPAARGDNQHLSESSFVKHFYPARDAAGRPDLPFHYLRHFGATHYLQTGATVRELQAWLGDSTMKAAMTYLHTVGREEELARRMSEIHGENW